MDNKLDVLNERLGVSQAYAASAGYFLLAFGVAEEEMNRTIWATLSIDGRGGHEITTSMRDFGQRMLLLLKLGKVLIRNNDIRQDCSNIIRALQYINDQRVDLVHGFPVGWAAETESTLLERATSERDHVKHKLVSFSAEYLCDMADYALLTAHALRALRQSIERGSRHAPPSLDKRP